MPEIRTAAGADVSSTDPHTQALEDAIKFCIQHRAVVSFVSPGDVRIKIQGSFAQRETFLDAIEALQ